MKRILLIDNFDSFTYNIAHILEGQIQVELSVIRNNEIPSEITSLYDGVILSPGPGIPNEAGSLMKLIRENMHKIPMFGICLGHQAIAESLGGSLINTTKVHHGVSTMVLNHENKIGILKDIGSEFQAGRYHSWVVNKTDFPQELMITASTKEGTIMAFQHRTLPVYGVQFHPESILTPQGKNIIKNWIDEIPESR